MFEHTFRWQSEAFTLVYFIECNSYGRQLVVEDVIARSLEIVNSVPDWIVEREACAVAALQVAHYL